MELCGAAALAAICYACGLSMLVGVLLCLLAFVSSLGYCWLPLTGVNELYPGTYDTFGKKGVPSDLKNFAIALLVHDLLSWKQKNKHKNLSAKM